MSSFEQIDNENKEKLNKQDMKRFEQFMHEAVERGMAIPCTSTPASQDFIRNMKYR